MCFNQFCGEGSRAVLCATGLNKKYVFSLIALSISSALSATAAHAADGASKTSAEQTIVVTADDGSGTQSDPVTSYTVPATRSGTKLNLTQRDNPQSVSVLTQQRIKDQNLQNLGDALTNVTGISASKTDSERVDFYSRGFYISNYTWDDIPSTLSAAWNFGETDGDSAIYQRIDIVRGATGLMTGTGDPGAAINIIRKKADSKTFYR
jgi:Outer membrane receptor for ferric coprogen and ferric-rhodotorulic acid